MVAMVLASLTACSQPDPRALTTDEADYNAVCDVDVRGWGVDDSLVYPVLVTPEPTLRTPLHAGRNYRVYYNVRIAPQYGYTTVPMQLVVQQVDTLQGGHQHVVHNLLRQSVNPAVRDSLGRPLGPTWGSYIDYEAPMPEGLVVRFDSAGTYRMILTPLLPDQTALRHVASVGLSLHLLR